MLDNEPMKRVMMIGTSALLLCVFLAASSLAADVPGTRHKGSSVQEPPAPSRPGNPFPRNPDPPLKNPLRDDSRDLNPQNDPDVRKGIQDHYREYLRRQGR